MIIGPGQRVGAYEVGERLGAGGMGEVYRARDTRLGRFVAIKFVSPGLEAGLAAAERFMQEARVASSLNHPSIVSVYDVGQYDDRPFIVMEFIAGQTLASRLANGSLELVTAIDLAWQIADGLAAAHAAGIVHRDLKPQNIMLTSDGRPKIVDFGISKMAVPAAPDEPTAQRAPLTAPHVVLGTDSYMSPEQIAGRTVDFRTDQFAFGAMLYEMLSGRRAFKSKTSIETMAAIVGTAPTPIGEICPDLPQPIIRIVERCLAKTPGDRYHSTVDLAHDLRSTRDEIATGRLPRPMSDRRRRWSWRRALVVASIGITIIAVAWTTRWWSARSSHSPASASSVMRQVGVFPFTTDASGDDDKIFADGLADAVTGALYRLQMIDRTLRVIPANDLSRERVTTPAEAHQILGVTHVLTGSVHRTADAVRLALTVVDASHGRTLTSQSIEVVTRDQAGSSAMAIATVTAGMFGVSLERGARDSLDAGSTANASAFEAYVKGRGHLQRFDKADNIDRAIDLFTAAVRADPQYALAYAALGEAYWRKHERNHQAELIDQAIDACKAALRIQGRLAPVHVTLALIARGQGRTEEAIAAASHAVELDPTSTDAYRALAAGYEAAGRFQDAEATYKKAIEARSDDWAAYNALGTFYYSRQKGPEAEAAFHRVTELTPDNTRGWNNLGATYFLMRRYEEAAAMFEKSASIRPNLTAASNLGTYYFDRGRYADAARAFERAATLGPTDYRIWCNLGAALYWAPGERPKARAAYEKGITLAEASRMVNPRDAGVLRRLADANSMIGRRREAREAAAALERLKPDDADTLYALASIYEQLGDRVTAFVWLDRALKGGYSRERLERSPGMAELRKDPRYARMLK